MIQLSEQIMVTGGAGFLGSKIVSQLRSCGYLNIFVVRKNDYDLIDQAAVRRLLAKHCPSILIHSAATIGGIGANQAEPGRYFYENLIMGTMLQEEARRAGVAKFLSIGTVCSYPQNTAVPFRECDLWEGYPEITNGPYGLAKKMMLVQSQAYRQQYDFNAVHLLLVNMYGPSDNFDPSISHVIPALIKKCVEAKATNLPAIQIWGDGTASREFLHVHDAARAIVLAAQHYNKPEPVNIGSGFEITMRDLANKVARFTGYEGELLWDPTKPNGQQKRRLDVTRAYEEFGFNSSVPFDVGLRQTIDWYVQDKLGSN